MSLQSKFAGQGKSGRTMNTKRNSSMREAHYRRDGSVTTKGKVATTARTFVLGSDQGTMTARDRSTKLSENVPMQTPKTNISRKIIIKPLGQNNKQFKLPSGKFGRVENSTFSTRKPDVNNDIMTPNYISQIKLPPSKSKVGGSGKMKVSA